MAFLIDMPTVFMVCSALTLVVGVCMALVYATGKTYPGFGHWTIGSIGLGVAFTVFAYPEIFPPVVVMVGGNLCFALFGMLNGRGLRAFAGLPARNVPALAGLACIGLVAYDLSLVHPSMFWRVATLTLVLLPFYLECVWLVLRERAFDYPIVRRWLAAAFGLFLAWSVVRVLLMAIVEPNHQDIINNPSIIQAVTMVVSMTVCVATAIGFILLNFQRAAASLEKHQRRLAFAIGATQDAIWERNLATGAIFFSPRWLEMLGLPADGTAMDVDGWLARCHPDDVAVLRGRARAALEAKEDRPFVAEFRMRHADGSWRWIQTRGRVVQRDAAGRPLTMSGTNSDITDQLRARERQSRLESQLHQAQKMEALGTLAGGIAHDFNNILLGIMGNVELAAMDAPEGSRQAKLLANAEQASRRARDLIARIMTFSRPQEPSRQPVALAAIVQEVCALMRASLPAQVTIEARVEPEVPPVNGDPGQLHEVLMNLAVNAGSAIGDRPGRLEIGLRHGPPVAELLSRYPDLKVASQVQLVVRDSGVGMTPEVAQRIFEPFYTTKGPGQGSGLGLTMVHRIVTDLNGAITVVSAPGRGTEMTVFLPAAEELPAATGSPDEVPLAAQSPLDTGHRVLVIDDDPLVLNVTAMALQRPGWTVSAHAQPLAALEEFAKNPRAFAAVLTDLTMPQKSGLEVAREIRRQNLGVPIVVMTGHLTGRAQAEGAGIPNLRFIQKPFEIDQLLALVGPQAPAAGEMTG
ncbi:MAG TPA: PAS domain-containing protein [Lacunisphaera sp.]|nr:PAS domain-containing protein [Lacunisphaera sp.]